MHSDHVPCRMAIGPRNDLDSTRSTLDTRNLGLAQQRSSPNSGSASRRDEGLSASPRLDQLGSVLCMELERLSSGRIATDSCDAIRDG